MLYEVITVIVGDFSEGSASLALYVDDVLVTTETVTNSEVFLLGSVVRGNKFQIILTGKATIERVILGASPTAVLERAYGE